MSIGTQQQSDLIILYHCVVYMLVMCISDNKILLNQVWLLLYIHADGT